MSTPSTATPSTADPSTPDPSTPARGLRTPRGRRGAVAGATALLAVLATAAGAVEAVSLARHRRTVALDVGSVARFGRDTHLGDRVVLVVSVVAVALGVLLLLAALVPARRRLVELVEPDPAVATGLSRRSLHRTLTAAALGVDGISDARVSGRRRLTVRVTTSLRGTEALPDLVRERVTARLTELAPVRTRTVRVRLIRKES